jgi:hypothetical protein
MSVRSTKLLGSYAGTINGRFFTSFFLQLLESRFYIKSSKKVRGGFVLSMAHSYRLSLLTQPTGMVTVRFGIATD